MSETNEHSLRTSYGTVILSKGTKLYCMKHTYRIGDPVLFVSLHPSEWSLSGNTKIITLELKKDISLLFMISLIRNLSIISAINTFLGNTISNLFKNDYEKIKNWIPYLQKEQLDGWLTSIDNTDTIEFAIINDPSIFKVMDCKPIYFDWCNPTYIKDSFDKYRFIPKNWGIHYSISKESKMILNSRFKPQIEAYIHLIKNEFPKETILYTMFINAGIEYIDAPEQKIRWLV